MDRYAAETGRQGREGRMEARKGKKGEKRDRKKRSGLIPLKKIPTGANASTYY